MSGCICPMAQDECWGVACDCLCHDDDLRRIKIEEAEDWEEKYGERPWEAREAAMRDNER